MVNNTTFTPQQMMAIQQSRQFVAQKLMGDHTGHDFEHISRVVKLAQHLQKSAPHTNLFIITLSAYFHDIIDDKVVENSNKARQELIMFMSLLQVTEQEQAAILAIIDNMSFSKNLTTQHTLSDEGKIVQDADRLDALGAIGIGRTFYYGGNKQHPMHSTKIAARENLTEAEYRKPSTVINHFYEKLLLLKDQLNTAEAKRLAEQRHQLLIDFLRAFENEWNVNLDD